MLFKLDVMKRCYAVRSCNKNESLSSNPFLTISEEVQQAIYDQQPVVVLESMNVLRHGGKNALECFDTVQLCEQTVRHASAIPATTAVIKGRMKIGLNDDELEMLASSESRPRKVSRRDLPFLLNSQHNGLTTVAAAMIMAELAGLRIVAAGGLGGVHIEGNKTFDISSDLQELARTNVAIVCSGSKSIIDPELTLEYLETQGVPVIGYRTSSFPQFCVRDTGYVLDYRMDEVREVAAVLHNKWTGGLDGGVVIANPVPMASAIDTNSMNINIHRALNDMHDESVSRQERTTYRLDKVNELTEGQSQGTNIQLLIHNAQLAAELAIAYGVMAKTVNKDGFSYA